MKANDSDLDSAGPTQPIVASERDWGLEVDPTAFLLRLEAALHGPLPGIAAQRAMAPAHRRFLPEPDEALRQSAVMALLYATNDGLNLVFTLRPGHLAHHAGEVCFPGGGREAADHTLVATALREVEEELGLPRSAVRILGPMTPLYIGASSNLVHPFVGWVPRLPPLAFDRTEVERVVEVPVTQLLEPHTRNTFEWVRDGQRLTAPCYRVDGLCIWGATAMMLSELLQILQRVGLPKAHPT